MSLWEVNDRFGAILIDKFYKYLAKGYAKNDALHQAKLEVLNQGNALYAHPYYWSSLVLMGDESKINNKTPIPLTGLLFGFLLLATLSFSSIKQMKKKS